MIPDFFYKMCDMMPRRQVERRVRRYLADKPYATVSDILEVEFGGPKIITFSRLFNIVVRMHDIKQYPNEVGPLCFYLDQNEM